MLLAYTKYFLLQTTSPSYLLMASLDAAQAQAFEIHDGRQIAVPLSAIAKAREALQKLPGISLLEDSCEGHPSYPLLPSPDPVSMPYISSPFSRALRLLAIDFHIAAGQHKDTCLQIRTFLDKRHSIFVRTHSLMLCCRQRILI